MSGLFLLESEERHDEFYHDAHYVSDSVECVLSLLVNAAQYECRVIRANRMKAGEFICVHHGVRLFEE